MTTKLTFQTTFGKRFWQPHTLNCQRNKWQSSRRLVGWNVEIQQNQTSPESPSRASCCYGGPQKGKKKRVEYVGFKSGQRHNLVCRHLGFLRSWSVFDMVIRICKSGKESADEYCIQNNCIKYILNEITRNVTIINIIFVFLFRNMKKWTVADVFLIQQPS